MVLAGNPSCVPVGPKSVPEGFEASSPSWGFRAIVPQDACAAGERAAVGERTCKPVDDCSAPFPPANAKIVVRSGAAPGSGVQSNLADAIAAASDGDTIAIDEGTYPGVIVDRDVTLVGRCASKVILQAGSPTDNGIGVDGKHTVALRSMTLRGFRFGIWAGNGASVTADRAIFTSQDGVAAWVTNGAAFDLRESLVDGKGTEMLDGVVVARGGRVTMSDSELREVHVAADAYGIGSRVSGTRLVVSEHSEEMSALVVASQGAQIDVDHSRLVASEQFIGGAKPTDTRVKGESAPSTLRIASSELIRSQPTNPSGFDIEGGSTLEISDSTLAYRARIAISANESANVSLARTVIRPVSDEDAANLRVGSGIVVNDGVRLSLEDSAIVGASQSAILASKGCRIQLTGSLVRDTWEFERVSLNKRMKSGQAISLSGDAVLEMTNSTLENNAGVSIWLAADTPRARIERSAVLSTLDPERSNAKAGVLAYGGTLEITDSLFHGIPDTALGLGNVTGSVSRSLLSKSDVGFRLLGESRLIEEHDETRRPDPGQVLTRDNVLVELGSPTREEDIAVGECRCKVAP